MKKIILIAASLLLCVSVRAQVLKLYKGSDLVATYSADEVDKAVFEQEEPSTDTKEYVDLGLPSGTLWATCNIGASSPEEYGDYFAWGETSGYNDGKTDFSWSTYKWMTSGQSSWQYVTKYTFADGQTSGCWYDSDGNYVGTTVNGVTYTDKTELDLEDDAAYVNWGAGWRMPSHAQQQELVNSSYTSTEWTTMNGVYGRKITSLTNGNSIFLPAAGYRYNGSLNDAGSGGYYWSRSLCSYYSGDAWLLDFLSGVVFTGNGNGRYYGQSVRPVRAVAE